MSPWSDLLPALSKEASRAPEDTYLPEQEPSDPGHRTRNTTRQWGTPVNRSQVAKDTAHTQRNAPSGHTSGQEPSGIGHGTHNTKQRANTPVNRAQVAKDTAHTTQHTEAGR